jgi:hypothetical protein
MGFDSLLEKEYKNIRFDTAVSTLLLGLSESMGTQMTLPWCKGRGSVILIIQHIEVQLYSIVTKNISP